MEIHVLFNGRQDYYGPHYHSLHSSLQSAMLKAQTENAKLTPWKSKPDELEWRQDETGDWYADDWEVRKEEVN